MKLLLLRHAESYGNATGNYSIAAADTLSELGEKQAAAIVGDLSAYEFSRIVVSPLKRAQDTIGPYLKETGKMAEVWPELAEACWHDEREPSGPAPNYIPARVVATEAAHFFFRDNNAVKPDDGETYGAGLLRVKAAVQLLAEFAENNDGLILMAVHGHVIRELLNLLLKTHPYNEFHHDNCGMTLLSYDGTWISEFRNKTPEGLPWRKGG